MALFWELGSDTRYQTLELEPHRMREGIEFANFNCSWTLPHCLSAAGVTSHYSPLTTLTIVTTLTDVSSCCVVSCVIVAKLFTPIRREWRYNTCLATQLIGYNVLS